jgi:tetraacyldisaccharide 4'-kinase
MLRLLLFPFALLFDVVTSLRNSLYDKGYKPTAQFDLPVIGVGNLAVGGTGKTPMIEYLIRLLYHDFKVATLSRGYGRVTKGIHIANANDSASSIGDEPFQLYRKFDNNITVCVGEERALAIPFIIDHAEDTEIILLDDAFQHRKVKPSFQILLTDYHNLFYKDMLLPAGRLRESSRGLSRSDVIVVTKCPPDIKEEDMMEIDKSVRQHADKPLFFSVITYGNPVALDHNKPTKERVVLVSGIANHKPVETYTNSHYKLMHHFAFPDHHRYTEKDLITICAMAKKEDAVVITTEKDAVKIQSPAFNKYLNEIPFFYLPIKTEFLKNGKDFDEMVLNAIRRHAS